MKITLTRKKERKDTHRVVELPVVLELLKKESLSEPVASLRHNLSFFSGDGDPIELNQLSYINFTAWYKRSHGVVSFVEYNGLVLITFEHLSNSTEAERVRLQLSRLPQTLATFIGSSGRTVKVLVSFTLYDETLPQTEQESSLFHAHAYIRAVNYYQGQFPDLPIRMEKPSLMSGCRYSFDPNLYYNPSASPFLMDQPLDMPSEKNYREVRAEETEPLKRMLPGFERYQLVSFLYETSLKKAILESQFPQKETKQFLHLLTLYCFRSGIPEEEAVAWTMFRVKNYLTELEIRETFRNTYLIEKRFGEKPVIPSKQTLYLQMEDFMKRRYEFRYNKMTQSVEYREQKSFFFEFQEVDDRMLNSISIRAMAEGIEMWDKDVKRWINSDKVPVYSPLEEFLFDLPEWDGKERIMLYANRIPSDDDYWKSFFYRWFLSMVANWTVLNKGYANSVSPLLVGYQGCGKSTFCRNILPPELRNYYTDRIDFSMKRDAELFLGRFALINMDEFDQINPKEQAFLKHILQKPIVNTRKPHRSNIQELRRYASFIATSNHYDLLTDSSGSRRFITININAPVDNITTIDYAQLYAEAYYKIKNRERYWFTPEEERILTEHNRRFELLTPIEQLFVRYYRAALPGEACQEMMAVHILENLRKKSGISLSDVKIITFGRILRKLNIPVKRAQSGNYYLVVENSGKMKDV